MSLKIIRSAPPRDKDSTILVDADSIIYRAGYGTSEPEEINAGVDRILDEIQVATNSDYIWVYLSGPLSYRNYLIEPLVKPYKGNRDKEKPVWFEPTYRYMKDVYDAFISQENEADDLISIVARTVNSPIIAHIDKDLNQIPGVHYNYMNGSMYTVSPEEAERNFLLQLLTGDTADNIEGVRGIGPKKAAGILDAPSFWEAIKEAYIKQYSDYFTGLRVMKHNADLLWLQRSRGELFSRDVYDEFCEKYGEVKDYE